MKPFVYYAKPHHVTNMFSVIQKFPDYTTIYFKVDHTVVVSFRSLANEGISGQIQMLFPFSVFVQQIIFVQRERNSPAAH